MNGRSFRRGAVHWVDFTGNRVQVVPLTSNTGRVYPGEALVNLGDRPSKAMADQIATVAKERVG